MSSNSTIYKKLVAVQGELKAPKSRVNSFGKYNYRNLEDIQEAVKPLCAKYGLLPLLTDKVYASGDVLFVEATAKVIDVDSQEEISVVAYAEIDRGKKGQDAPQTTGTASSYARKYAMNGLFQIDDTKDSDTDEHRTEQEERKKKATAEEAELRKKLLKDFKDYLKKEGIEEAFVVQSCGIKKLDDIPDKRMAAFSNKENLEAIKEQQEKWQAEKEAK